MEEQTKLSIGEIAQKLGISVLEVLTKMRYGDLKYKIENAHYAFSPKQRPVSKNKIFQLTDSLRMRIGAEPSQQEWHDFRRENSFVFNRVYIPSAQEVVQVFESWENFLKEAKGKEAEKLYQKLKRTFLEADKKYTPRLPRKSPVHDLVVREIAKAGNMSDKNAEQFLLENRFFDGEYMEKNLGTLEKIMATKIGERLYHGEGKKAERELICDSIQGELQNPQNLSYLGLPAANFLCYLTFHKHFRINPKKSLVAERDEREANAMACIIEHHNLIREGEIFNGLRLYRGSVERALEDPLSKGMKFQLIFLDYEGAWSPGKCRAIQNLFMYNHLEDKTLLYITLNNSPIELGRINGCRGLAKGYGTRDQNQLAKECVEKNAKSYAVKQILEPQTSQYKDTVDMITLGFKLERI